jgi:hypothetical protein
MLPDCSGSSSLGAVCKVQDMFRLCDAAGDVSAF